MTQDIKKENPNQHNYCLILAGGRGRRLWPVSTEERPKQFIDFFGTGKTLIQQTFQRFASIFPKENIYIATQKGYKQLLREQLPDITEDQILAEPIHRGTAPLLAWVTHRIAMRDKDAAIVVTPSDQLIVDEDGFREDVEQGIKHVRQHKCTLTMGVKPTRPEPGYGYIQMGQPTGNGVFAVESFTEKPEREFAEVFVGSGEFLWNTGLIVSTIEHLRECLGEVLPNVMRSFDDEAYDQSYQLWKEEDLWMQRNYTKYPNISIELGILEKLKDVCVKEGHFGWIDIGSWHGIFDAQSSDDTDNVSLGTETYMDNAHGNLICLADGRKAVIQGLDNYIVAEKGDFLLITPRSDSSNQILKLLNKLWK